jgi:SAM-dependent methyltransferase
VRKASIHPVLRRNSRSRGGSDDGIRRSVALFRAFLTEQTDPDGFYSLIAADTCRLVERHQSLDGRTVVDFGGGPGFYSAAFEESGARSVVVDASFDEVTLHGGPHRHTVVARAEQPPLADESVDVAFSSNLLEHVEDLAAVADRIVRVVRPGGLVVLSYTVWWGPWGGHETSPWHYLGGHRAARRYARRHGHPPKNVFGESMYAATVRDGLRWLRSRPDLDVLEVRPRYLPAWSSFLLRVPLLRELVAWNLWMVLRRPV